MAQGLFSQVKSHHATSGGGQILICVNGEGWYQEGSCI